MFPFTMLAPLISPGSTVEVVPVNIASDGSVNIIGDNVFAVASPAGMINTVSGKVVRLSMGPGSAGESMLIGAVYGSPGTGFRAAIGPVVRK